MTELSKPVWVWLPGAATPIRCGLFRLRAGVGAFTYDEAYRHIPGAVAIDPVSLPLTRSRREFKEVRQGGLFGVFRDASPEGFGLALLERKAQRTLDDPMARLELSEGDAVGAVEVCDDIASKLAFRPPGAGELLDALAKLPPESPSSQAAREILGEQGTSLGGERPKLTVQHEGQLWIAKLQDRGDAPHMPLREYVAMRVARRLGLNTCDVVFRCEGDREMLLVRRFDRRIGAQGQLYRQLFASAHTVLRLDTHVRGDRARSYVALARELQRWCGSGKTDPKPHQRELWRRMACNALIGNGDDHPRNHGLLHRDGHWELAPAFDIAPYITFSKTLAMSVNRAGRTAATRANLLADCESFSMDRAEAAEFLARGRELILDTWPAEVAACDVAPAELPARDPAAWLDAD